MNDKIHITIENGDSVEATAPIIISASRSTDIPAFYAKWFFNRLAKGYCAWYNPFNQQKMYISFKNCKVVIFWTKNPKPMLNKLDKLKDFKYYFLYTLNAYPKEIEVNLPPLDERIESFKILSKYCPVIWRYDPILVTEGIDENWHIEKFEYLAKALKGYTKHCKISFLIESYKGCDKNLHKPSIWQKDKILSAISKIASDNGIQIDLDCPNDIKLIGWKQDIYTIMVNLLDNSLFWIVEKECVERRINIVVSKANVGFTLNYTDSGPGISNELLESGVIFDPEFSTKPDGTGLGLSIAGEAATRNSLTLTAVQRDNGAHFILSTDE